MLDKQNLSGIVGEAIEPAHIFCAGGPVKAQLDSVSAVAANEQLVTVKVIGSQATLDVQRIVIAICQLDSVKHIGNAIFNDVFEIQNLIHGVADQRLEATASGTNVREPWEQIAEINGRRA